MSDSIEYEQEKEATKMRHIAWTPKRSIEECEKILTAPGQLHEMELALVDGRVMRVYKLNPPNVRSFWLMCADRFRDRDYVVFENERFTYAQMHERVSRIADLLYTQCAVRKGDRVAIATRNYPDWISTFFAAHLLGAVPTLLNALLPLPQLTHCVALADPAVLLLDPERAARTSAEGFDALRGRCPHLVKMFVVRAHESGVREKREWEKERMVSLDAALAAYKCQRDVWKEAPIAAPEDDCTIFFTSGTTGEPKGVLSSQRGFTQNVLNLLSGRFRAMLRNGEELPKPGQPAEAEEVLPATLLSVPLFHVTGCTSTLMTATALGGKIVLMRKWDKDEAVRIIPRERITSAGGVPSIISDLLDSALADGAIGGLLLENLSCGGAPASEGMPAEVARRFKGVSPGQGYGLSETNAVTASIQGEDFLLRPTSTGLPAPVCDLLIVDPATQKISPRGHAGELWIRGSNVMKCYWRDPAATEKAMTRDGWFKSGDLASIDEEGFLYIKDRVKDIIIRGGENIHSVEVENALYHDERIADAAAVSVPDRRLGELVAAVVVTRPAFHGAVKEAECISKAGKILPQYAVPVMVLVQDEPIERNVNGKLEKARIRKHVRKEWARRQKSRKQGVEVQAKL